MKRWIFTILLFLLLVSGGAIVNVAVAGLIAQFSRAPHRSSLDASLWCILSERVPEFSGEAHPTALGPVSHRSFGATTVARFFAPDSMQSPHHERIVVSVRMGFPLRCLSSRLVKRNEEWSELGPSLPLFSRGGPYGDLFRPQLPLRPIWPGFAVNTLFYATILWLLIPGPFVLRRLIRRKRGRCPKCGYDLRGQPPEAGAGGCPECGWNRASQGAAKDDAV